MFTKLFFFLFLSLCVTSLLISFMQKFNLDMVIFSRYNYKYYFLQIYKLEFLKQSCFQRSTKGDLQPHALKSFMHTISQAQNPAYAYLDTNLGAQVCLPLTLVTSLFPSVLILSSQRHCCDWELSLESHSRKKCLCCQLFPVLKCSLGQLYYVIYQH